jgi:hypothetical protein
MQIPSTGLPRAAIAFFGHYNPEWSYSRKMPHSSYLQLAQQRLQITLRKIISGGNEVVAPYIAMAMATVVRSQRRGSA